MTYDLVSNRWVEVVINGRVSLDCPARVQKAGDFCHVFTSFICKNAIIEPKIAPFPNLTHIPALKLASLS